MTGRHSVLSVQGVARRSVQSALESQTFSIALHNVRQAVRTSYFGDSLQLGAAFCHMDGPRQSLVADGSIPVDVLQAVRDPRSIMERTRSMSHRITQKIRDASAGGTLGPALLVALTVCSLLTYHFLSKIIFGGRPKEQQPNKFVLIALTRLLSAALYFAMSRVGLSSEDVRRHLRGSKAWLVCIPYSVGLLAVYVTAMMALEFIALSARNAIMQSRLLLDLLLGSFLLGVPVTRSKVSGVFAIIGAVGTSMLTVKQSAMSKDPTTGMLIMLANNCISSSTYAYFPYILPRYKVPPTICSFVCAMEVFVLCSIGALVEALVQGSGSAVLGGFQGQDALLVLAISLTDTCYFFLPILLPPIVLTLCVTSTIPCGYFLENFYFGMPIEPLTAVAMLTVGLSTIAYVVNATVKAPTAAGKEDEEPEEVQDKKPRISVISNVSGFFKDAAGDGVHLEDIVPTLSTTADESCDQLMEDKPPDRRSGSSLDAQSWERLAAQLQAREDDDAADLDVLSERGFQPTLLAHRQVEQQPAQAVGSGRAGDLGKPKDDSVVTCRSI